MERTSLSDLPIFILGSQCSEGSLLQRVFLGLKLILFSIISTFTLG